MMNSTATKSTPNNGDFKSHVICSARKLELSPKHPDTGYHCRAMTKTLNTLRLLLHSQQAWKVGDYTQNDLQITSIHTKG